MTFAMQTLVLAVACAMFSCGPLSSVALAAWTSDPTVNLAVAPSTHWQLASQITPDGLGGVYVIWEDAGPDLYSHQSVRVQHITSIGAVDPVWPPGGIAPDSTGVDGYDQNVIGDGRHGVIIGWFDYLTADTARFQAQRLDSTGKRMWGRSGVPIATPLGAAPSGGRHPAFQFVPDSAGGAIAAWDDSRFSFSWTNIFARRVDRFGNPRWTQDGVRICPGNWRQSAVRAVPDLSGGALLAWTDQRSGWPSSPVSGVYAQRVNGFGSLQWGSSGVPVCPASVGPSSLQGMCSDSAGGAYISWLDTRVDAHGDVYMHHLLANGTLDPAWPPGGLVIDSTSNTPGGGTLVADGSGGALLLWVTQRLPYTGYFGQHVTSGGAITWAVGGVYLGPPLSGNIAAVSDGKGGLFYAQDESPNITWCSGSDRLLVQHVSNSGAPLWGSPGHVLSTGCGSRSGPAVCTDDADGMIAAWQDYRVTAASSDFNHSNIYAQRIQADGTLGGDVVDALLSFAGADATPDRVSLRWFTSEHAIADADVERNAGDGWVRVARTAPDGEGMLPYQDTDVVPGHRYGYRLIVTLDGRDMAMGETWVTVPLGVEFGLRAVQPNPSSGDLAVSFTIVSRGPASLEVLDVAGRRVALRDVSALEPGSHVVSFAREASALRPGVYAIRLRSGGRTATTRAVLIR